MADIAALTALIEPPAHALGLAVVRVGVFGGNSDPVLQVMAERPETRQLSLDDCAELSRALSDVLDPLEGTPADPIPHAYRLEVSSPGIDRPLTRLQDFADWAGHEARIKLVDAVDGRKHFDATLGRVENDTIYAIAKHGSIAFDFANLLSAKLILTDALIKATAPLDTEGADIVREDDNQDSIEEDIV